MSDEARLEEGPAGLATATRGWFVVNVADAAWRTHPRFGASWGFESRDVAPFAELGINIRVLDPGQPSGLYHSESHQEGFLVLAGEALLVVGDDQRPLRAWDFLHCPPGTDHLLVGARRRAVRAARRRRSRDRLVPAGPALPGVRGGGRL